MLTHPSGLFGRLPFSLYVVLPLKFLYALQPLNCISSQTLGARRPQVGLCPIFLVISMLVCTAFAFN